MELKTFLDDKKLIPRETYKSVLKRLLKKGLEGNFRRSWNEGKMCKDMIINKCCSNIIAPDEMGALIMFTFCVGFVLAIIVCWIIEDYFTTNNN